MQWSHKCKFDRIQRSHKYKFNRMQGSHRCKFDRIQGSHKYKFHFFRSVGCRWGVVHQHKWEPSGRFKVSQFRNSLVVPTQRRSTRNSLADHAYQGLQCAECIPGVKRSLRYGDCCQNVTAVNFILLAGHRGCQDGEP